jgi:hypothetical protein
MRVAVSPHRHSCYQRGNSAEGQTVCPLQYSNSTHWDGVQALNLLKPSGFFTYHQVLHSAVLHGVRFALSVLYGSENRQRRLLYTSLTDWFL